MAQSYLTMGVEGEGLKKTRVLLGEVKVRCNSSFFMLVLSEIVCAHTAINNRRFEVFDL